MKKKKSANSGLPYSFLYKLAPLTTLVAELIVDSASSLFKIIFFPFSSIASSLTVIFGLRLNPSKTSSKVI